MEKVSVRGKTGYILPDVHSTVGIMDAISRQQRKLLSDYIGMVEQSAMAADSELYSYILKAVTEGTTFVVLKSVYSIPCERDMFYDRRRKFYWVLSGVR